MLKNQGPDLPCQNTGDKQMLDCLPGLITEWTSGWLGQPSLG